MGSAFSKVMINMQLAVETGNESLKDFASVAGMTTDEFSKAFKQDATGALISFIQGLSNAESQGTSAIKVLNDMGITEVRLRDSLLRAGSASSLFNETIALGTEAWEENTALTNEANQRYATTESQIKILKNEIVDMARDIGVELLPTIKDGLVVVKDLIDKFNNLSPATKENIIKLAALSAVAGPVVGTTGKLAEGFGSVLKIASKLSTGLGKAKTATEAIGTASAVASGTGGVASLATSLGGVAIAAAPYLAAGAAIAGAGYLVYKGLSQEVIPEVDLFADKIEYTATAMDTSGQYMASSVQATVTKISEATKTAVGAYVDLDDNARNEMQSLYINSTTISDQIKNDMTSKFNEMSTQVIAGYEKQKNDSIAQMQEMFSIQSQLTAQEQAEIIAATDGYYENKKTQTQNYEKQINEIINTASQEKRALTQDETQQITELQNQMRENAVKALSENEVEAQVILQRMKDYDGRVTAEQAAQHIAKLNESRDNAVATANDEYEKRIATITRLRDESGVISAEQANKMIEDAKEQRDGVVEQAENTRKEAVDKIFSMNKDLQKDVDSSTGKIIGFWQKLFGTWDKWQPETKYANVQYTERMSGNRIGANALGTSYFQGGLTAINERGYEVVELPRGTKIKNHLQSENMIKDTATKTANSIINGLSEILNTDKEVILVLNDRAVGEAIIPIISNGLAQNTKLRR
ncbi:phage tail tape measure protein [Clostridium nigeriense]|uniref:phage tail tape measure protein n=1 Tax=Clostridium nigeriense TaxID=1805470 RepID=UPI003D333F7D